MSYYSGPGRPEDIAETERWERLKAATDAATAPTTPREGDGTGAAAQTLSGRPERSMSNEDVAAFLHAELEVDADYRQMLREDRERSRMGVPVADADAYLAARNSRQAVVDQFKAALLTGLDGLQRYGQFELIDPEDVADLIARVAMEVRGG